MNAGQHVVRPRTATQLASVIRGTESRNTAKRRAWAWRGAASTTEVGTATDCVLGSARRSRLVPASLQENGTPLHVIKAKERSVEWKCG